MSDTPTQMPAAPTRAQYKPFKEVRTIGEALKHPDMIERFKLATPKHLSPERMLRVCAMAVTKTPKLAECDLMSLLGAMLSLAMLGLEPNTPLGHAFLIPYEKRSQVNGKWVTVAIEVQVVIGYRGYIDLARRAGSLVSLHADVVYEGDEFSFSYGSDMHLRHVPSAARKQHKPIWAYFHARLTDGEAFEVLPYQEILALRNGAEGYKSALRNKERNKAAFEKNPWVAFEHEMAAKSMIRRINKRLPMSIEMASAGALDAMSEAGKVDFRAIATAPISEMMETRELSYDEYVPPFDIPGEEEREEAPAETREETREEPRQQRQEPKEAAKSSTPAQTAQRQPAAATPPMETVKEEPAQDEPFWLVDGEGNMANTTPYKTPLAYAQALEQFFNAAFPGDREAILEQNEEFIGPAEHASTGAHEIFERLRAGLAGVDATDPPAEEGLKAKEAPEQPDGWVVAVPLRTGGKPDLPAYLAAARASLAQHVTTDAGLTAWRAANKPTYDGMPKATKFGVDSAIAEHRKTLGLDKPPAEQAKSEPAAEETRAPAAPEGNAVEDKAAAWAASAIATIDALPSGGDALRWADTNATDMTWMKTARPELYTEVRAAISRKQGGA